MAEEIKSETPPERPEWLPERFESGEALAKSYDETRREMDRLRSQMETERQQFNTALEQLETRSQQQPAPTQQQGQEFNPLEAAYTRAYEEGDTAAMLRLSADAAAQRMLDPITKAFDERIAELKPTLEAQTQATRESQIRMAEDIVARQLGPDTYAELLPSISTLIQDHPHYLPTSASVEGYADAILAAAKLAQHDSLTKTVKQLEDERSEKLAAQTVTGAGRGSVYSKDEQEQMRENIRNARGDSYGAMMAREGR